MKKYLRDLSISVAGGIIAGIVAGLIVGAFLYGIYYDDPELYVFCEKKFSDNSTSIFIQDKLKVTIENKGKPALDTFMVFTYEEREFEDNRFAFGDWIDLGMIGDEPIVEELNFFDARKIAKGKNFEIAVDCENCKDNKIYISNECKSLK